MKILLMTGKAEYLQWFEITFDDRLPPPKCVAWGGRFFVLSHPVNGDDPLTRRAKGEAATILGFAYREAQPYLLQSPGVSGALKEANR